MTKFDIDYNLKSTMTNGQWERYVIRNKIKECKEHEITQSKAVDVVNAQLKIEQIDVEIKLPRVKYYWKNNR